MPRKELRRFMSTIADAVPALANGGMVLVVDEDRENEGDLKQFG